MKRLPLVLGLWLITLAGILFLISRRPPVSETPKALWTVPSFEMTGVTTQGQTKLRLQDLLGRPWVANFIYTRCGGPCPVMSQKMAALQRTLPPEVRLVSFSIDPERDTPEVLQKYARRFRADPARWVFVRGDKRALHHLMYEGFRLPIAENRAAPAGFELEHSTRFVLVNAEGVIRGAYDSTQGHFMETIRMQVARELVN